jgi:ribosomal protein L11 methyltransferase
MTWLHLETRHGQRQPEILEHLLEELGAVAVWLSDAGDEPILEPAPGQTPLWSSTIVNALFPAEVSASELAAALEDVVDGRELTFATLEDRDWLAQWQQNLRPLSFGKRLNVLPPGTAAAPQGASVWLAPGMGFGTGEHPTTAMCLAWLTEQELAHTAVLDYGCGSGLLAIAALKLGAARAGAVDIDPQALTATRENAIANDCIDRLSVNSPEEICHVGGYDLLVANILSRTLIELGPALDLHMRPGARLALSGILAGQARSVQAAWSGWAELQVDRQVDDWVLLTGHKHGLLA